MNPDRYVWMSCSSERGPRWDLWDDVYGIRVAMVGYVDKGKYRPVVRTQNNRWATIGDGPMSCDEAKKLVMVTIRLEEV